MSKTVDILCVGGVRANTLFNAPVPVETYHTFPFAGGEASYTVREFTLNGAKYRIATPTGQDVPDDNTIVSAIIARGHTPAWDLRAPFPRPQDNET